MTVIDRLTEAFVTSGSSSDYIVVHMDDLAAALAVVAAARAFVKLNAPANAWDRRFGWADLTAALAKLEDPKP